MRVEVDRDRCEGNAVCVGIAPDLFDLDDDDYAVVKADPVPAGQEDLAEQSVDDLSDIDGLAAEEAGKLIMKARAHWFEASR